MQLTHLSAKKQEKVLNNCHMKKEFVILISTNIQFLNYKKFLYTINSEKFRKDMKVDNKFHYLSDLHYELPLKIIFQEIFIKRKAGEKIDMVEGRHRKELLEAEISRLSNQWEALT